MLLKDYQKIRVVTLEKKQGKIRKVTLEKKTVPCNKNSKGSSSRQNKFSELPNLYSSLQMEDPSQQVLVEENNATVLPEEKKIQTWIMPLREDQIFAGQKGTFKHNSNCKNQK